MGQTEFISLSGHVPYGPMREVQTAFVEKRSQGEIPDTVFFLEHTPVVTRGSGLQYGSPATQSVAGWTPQLLPKHFEFFEVERGGDLTLHEPGQLVIYPIVHLGELDPANDVGGFLRRFEDVLILALQKLGLPATRRDRATGVWVGENPKRLQKIISMGIAVRKWVTFHGAALNWTNDVNSFQWIVPCGFSPDIMTRLGPPHARADIESAVIEAWKVIMGGQDLTRRDSSLAALSR
jgi:lipoyl(octanoyl) transferase